MNSRSSDSSSQRPELIPASISSIQRVVAGIVIGLVLLYVLWTLRAPSPPPRMLNSVEGEVGAVLPDRVPLVTGEEPLIEIFTRAGCPVCHSIPGISGANGRMGPRLILGTTGGQRLNDPGYTGPAKTVHDYIVESVIEPGRFVVAGYPG